MARLTDAYENGPTAGSEPEAMAIYQAHLDVVTNLLWEGVWSDLEDHFLWPNTVIAGEFVNMVQNAEEQMVLLEQHRASLKMIGATAYHRVALRANQPAPDTVDGSHATYILQGTALLADPYVSRQKLTLGNGHWRTNGVTTETRTAVLDLVAPRYEALIKTRADKPVLREGTG